MEVQRYGNEDKYMHVLGLRYNNIINAKQMRNTNRTQGKKIQR